MNMILYFDTETTGLYPGQICQLSYVMQDKENLLAKNFFFSVDCVEREAFNVHGFSVEKLSQLSNGKRFNHHFNQINKDFETADLVVSHNISFDFSFTNTSIALSITYLISFDVKVLNSKTVDRLNIAGYT